MILSIVIRAILHHTPLPAFVERRPELSSPITSIRSLNEGVFLARHGLDPYDGGVFAHSPPYLYFFKLVPPGWIVWTIADLISAYALIRIRKSRAISSDAGGSGRVAALYLFNPYIILSNLARTTTSIDNALLLSAISLAASSSSHAFYSVASAVLLALAACTSLYPILLLPPVLMLIYSTTRSRTLTSIAGAVFAGTLAASLSMGWHHWNVILTVSDLAPNVGMWWYFFTEMFDHFRNFFLGVFQLHTLIYVLPVCLRLRQDPLFAILILVGVISTWKSYPTLGDLGLWAGLLGCFPDVVKLYLYTLILLPLLHSLWLLTGTGNANFFYAATMVHGLNSCLAIVDVLTAGMRLSVMNSHKAWKDNWVPVQFTSVE